MRVTSYARVIPILKQFRSQIEGFTTTKSIIVPELLGCISSGRLSALLCWSYISPNGAVGASLQNLAGPIHTANSRAKRV